MGWGPSTPIGAAPDPPPRRSWWPRLRTDSISGHWPVRQPVDPLPDRTDLAARHRRGGVTATPPDAVTGRLEGGFGPALEPRHDGGRRMPGLEPEQQVNAIRERTDTDRLGVEPAAQGDHVTLDDGGRVGRHQGNPAQGGPHEVTVQSVRCPAGNVVDDVHVRYLGRPLIGRSSRVRRPRYGPVSSCFPVSRDTTEALNDT